MESLRNYGKISSVITSLSFIAVFVHGWFHCDQKIILLFHHAPFLDRTQDDDLLETKILSIVLKIWLKIRGKIFSLNWFFYLDELVYFFRIASFMIDFLLETCNEGENMICFLSNCVKVCTFKVELHRLKLCKLKN